MKKVLIINGHPDKESFCYGIHHAYKKGLSRSKIALKEIYIRDLEFNPNLNHKLRTDGINKNKNLI